MATNKSKNKRTIRVTLGVAGAIAAAGAGPALADNAKPGYAGTENKASSIVHDKEMISSLKALGATFDSHWNMFFPNEPEKVKELLAWAEANNVHISLNEVIEGRIGYRLSAGFIEDALLQTGDH